LTVCHQPKGVLNHFTKDEHDEGVIFGYNLHQFFMTFSCSSTVPEGLMHKTVLCYGDSNTWGCNPALPHDRYPRDVRWTGVLQKLLGDEYYVIEEGCCGRTTVWDDPVEVDKNGKTYLGPCLESHRPVDLIVLMLGTNDLKQRYCVPPSDIARGIGVLCKVILHSEAGLKGSAPKILVVTPPRLGKLDEFAEMFAGGDIKSNNLATSYQKVLDELNIPMLDANTVVTTSSLDGLHWESAEHTKFARALADRIPVLLV
jgi:lysophospholipase L1-like esterase